MSNEEVDLKGQSLFEHLGELRTRLVYCAYILVIATGICYGFSEHIFNFIRAPIQPYLPNGGLIYTGPLDKFVAHIKIAFVCGIIISCPLWLYQVWKFVAPGLYSNERKYTIGFIFSGTALFLLGAAFSYWVVLPMAFHFLMNFGGNIDKPMISIDQYLGFFTQMCLMFGVSFELPLVIAILGMMGIVSHKFLTEKRRYAIMGLAIASAIITPPDLMSMIMMLIPMVGLYELGVFVVGIVEKKRAAEVRMNERE
ncbi:twin-arginine translocase subunit TatC [Bdellovibrio svalbardensis]|uniref:Sec-independent protein translocase protein TatC n=1 Tax=Bdellovibrio svalbardensis TaxID=2972972 RepID=A0ABT6DDR4_9BACT|nr:twin-arginine translocase subunit TatC [Bdellovibrio svalbardensis]MDG0814979.1 twin-arginine translocase subunit TatC [Bdellovibrio svalbardensis]